MNQQVKWVGLQWEESVDGPFKARKVVNVPAVNTLNRAQALAKCEALNALGAILQAKGKLSAAKVKTLLHAMVPAIDELAGKSWQRGAESLQAVERFSRAKRRGTAERDEAIVAKYLELRARGKGPQQACELIANTAGERFTAAYGKGRNKKKVPLSAAAIRAVVNRTMGKNTAGVTDSED